MLYLSACIHTYTYIEVYTACLRLGVGMCAHIHTHVDIHTYMQALMMSAHLIIISMCLVSATRRRRAVCMYICIHVFFLE